MNKITDRIRIKIHHLKLCNDNYAYRLCISLLIFITLSSAIYGGTNFTYPDGRANVVGKAYLLCKSADNLHEVPATVVGQVAGRYVAYFPGENVLRFINITNSGGVYDNLPWNEIKVPWKSINKQFGYKAWGGNFMCGSVVMMYTENEYVTLKRPYMLLTFSGELWAFRVEWEPYLDSEANILGLQYVLNKPTRINVDTSHMSLAAPVVIAAEVITTPPLADSDPTSKVYPTLMLTLADFVPQPPWVAGGINPAPQVQWTGTQLAFQKINLKDIIENKGKDSWTFCRKCDPYVPWDSSVMGTDYKPGKDSFVIFSKDLMPNFVDNIDGKLSLIWPRLNISVITEANKQQSGALMDRADELWRTYLFCIISKKIIVNEEGYLYIESGPGHVVGASTRDFKLYVGRKDFSTITEEWGLWDYLPGTSHNHIVTTMTDYRYYSTLRLHSNLRKGESTKFNSDTSIVMQQPASGGFVLGLGKLISTAVYDYELDDSKVPVESMDLSTGLLNRKPPRGVDFEEYLKIVKREEKRALRSKVKIPGGDVLFVFNGLGFGGYNGNIDASLIYEYSWSSISQISNMSGSSESNLLNMSNKSLNIPTGVMNSLSDKLQRKLAGADSIHSFNKLTEIPKISYLAPIVGGLVNMFNYSRSSETREKEWNKVTSTIKFESKTIQDQECIWDSKEKYKHGTLFYSMTDYLLFNVKVSYTDPNGTGKCYLKFSNGISERLSRTRTTLKLEETIVDEYELDNYESGNNWSYGYGFNEWVDKGPNINNYWIGDGDKAILEENCKWGEDRYRKFNKDYKRYKDYGITPASSHVSDSTCLIGLDSRGTTLHSSITNRTEVENGSQLETITTMSLNMPLYSKNKENVLINNSSSISIASNTESETIRLKPPHVKGNTLSDYDTKAIWATINCKLIKDAWYSKYANEGEVIEKPWYIPTYCWLTDDVFTLFVPIMRKR